MITTCPFEGNSVVVLLQFTSSCSSRSIPFKLYCGYIHTRRMSTIGSEAYLREQLEKSFRETKSLKQKVETLEKENYNLKKSLYELSVRYNAVAYQKHQPFSLDFLYENHSDDRNQSEYKANIGHNKSTGNASGSSTNPGQEGSEPMNVFKRSQSPAFELNGSHTSPSLNHTANSYPANLDAATKDNQGIDPSRNSPILGLSNFDKQPRLFSFKHDLKGHSGPIYTCQFSPSGQFIASGSFDKTIRLWDYTSINLSSRNASVNAIANALGNTANTANTNILTGHTHVVSDLSWSQDGQSLVSGSFDASTKYWNVETRTRVFSLETDGFVQSVLCTSPNMFAFSTSRQWLSLADLRTGYVVCAWKNNSVVSSIVALAEHEFMTADSLAQLKVWDDRTGFVVRTINNASDVSCESNRSSQSDTPSTIGNPSIGYSVETQRSKEPRNSAYSTTFDLDHSKKPVSSMAALALKGSVAIAVNSHDNVIRAYQYCSSLSTSSDADSMGSTVNTDSGISSAHDTSNQEITNSLTLSSTFKGHRNLNLPIKTAMAKRNDHVFIACGSIDHSVYVYPWNTKVHDQKPPQRLEGHSDRVHAVHFHPQDPVLCSGAADCTLKLWCA